MQDLRIIYDTKNGETKEKSYNTIMDFLDEMELDNPKLYTDIHAEFFENMCTGKSFKTMEELIEHCKIITK